MGARGMKGDTWELLALPAVAGAGQAAVHGGDGGGGWTIASPSAGFYAQAPRRGSLLGPGDQAGVLVLLGRVYRLVLPDGVAGFVDTPRPERKHLPVGYKTPLFELKRGAGVEALAIDPPAARADTGGLVVRAQQAGRFYRRPEPGAPAFVESGDTLRAGRTFGLLEVMKTFNPVKYTPGGGLPECATVERFLVGDGTDVAEGQPLLALAEPPA